MAGSRRHWSLSPSDWFRCRRNRSRRPARFIFNVHFIYVCVCIRFNGSRFSETVTPQDKGAVTRGLTRRPLVARCTRPERTPSPHLSGHSVLRHSHIHILPYIFYSYTDALRHTRCACKPVSSENRYANKPSPLTSTLTCLPQKPTKFNLKKY